MKSIILLVSIALGASSCVKETTTKIITDDGKINQQNYSNPLAEGTVNGGGGKGVLCNRNGIQTIETLDLYEAQALYGLVSSHNPQTEMEAKELFAMLMAKHFWNPSTIAIPESQKLFLKRIEDVISKNIKFIDADKKLNLTFDSFEPLIEKNCQMVQVAHYYDESVLLIDKSLWDQMNWLNKIALLTHELVYLQDRINGSTNSMTSRKLVGQLFSTKGARPKADGVPTIENKYASCFLSDANNSRVGYFYAYDNPLADLGHGEQAPGLEFVFNYFLNSTNLFRTSAVSYKVDLNKLFQKGAIGFAEAYVQIDSYPTNKMLQINFNGNGEGTIRLADSKVDSTAQNLKFLCYGYKITLDNQTQSFLSRYSGELTEPTHKERFQISADGRLNHLLVRQVSTPNQAEIPYPTTCSFVRAGSITKVFERTSDERLHDMDYATHIIEAYTDDIQLSDELEATTTSNPNCQTFLKQQKDDIKKYGAIHSSYYSELLDSNSFRIHSSGGDDYVPGGPRTPSTLDEVYSKTQP